MEVGVSIADKIEREGGNSFLLSLRILLNLYQILDPKPAGVTDFISRFINNFLIFQ